jgi:hypothetical protein
MTCWLVFEVDEHDIDKRHASALLQSFCCFLKSVWNGRIDGDWDTTGTLADNSNLDAWLVAELVDDVLNIADEAIECGNYAGNHFLASMDRLVEQDVVADKAPTFNRLGR